MSSYDDFTLYIFQEDLAKLKSFRDPRSEGSLYGLWTSTLNPVVHVVHERRSSTQSSDSIREGLAQRYKMSYLGDWRVVEQSSGDSISPPRSFQLGGPTGFLAVTVVNAEVIPYMYEGPTDRHPKRGSVDILRGDNPFENDHDTRAIINGTGRAGQQWQGRAVPTGSEGYENYRSQQQRQRYGDTNPRSNQRRVAAAGEPVQTNSLQWYSNDGGEQNLKRVFEMMKGIADGKEVQMARDSQTQDITLSFKCRRKDWSIEFPASFPRVGAKIRGNGSGRNESPVEKRMSSTRNIHRAVEEICATIQQTY